MRRVAYVSGTRADYGLMASTLQRAQRDGLDVAMLVTGMHLLPRYGETIRDIERDGLRIAARVPVSLSGGDGKEMAQAIGAALIGFVETLDRDRPDIVLVLGDRGEMLAGALAALHLNIPIAHVHGGERSGTVDEPIRHAISKLAHYHFVSTEGARARLVRMGEHAAHVFVTGAPGLDDVIAQPKQTRASLAAEVRFDAARPIVLAIFHPVVQEAHAAGAQALAVLEGALGCGAQVLWFLPNADAGGQAVTAALEPYRRRGDIRFITHLGRHAFTSWMAAADALVGNSSAGIIEAASLGLWAINIGSRQNARERNENVIDVGTDRAEINQAIARALAAGRQTFTNVYGDGHAGERIVHLLASLPLEPGLLDKTNAY